MNSAASTRVPSVPDVALAEAALWMARLHGPERTSATESGWRDWFGANPDHAAAWELVTDVWNSSHAIPVGLVHPPVHIRPTFFRRTYLIATAVVAASLLVAIASMTIGRGVVATTVGEQKTLNLDDGTRIELNTATRLSVRYDAKTRVVELESGEAYFSVAHELRPFVVMVGNRKVIAMGTSFTIRRDQPAGDSVTVTMIEGRVAIAPTNAPNVLPQQQMPEITVLSAGERLQVRRHTRGGVDKPSIDRVTSWMRGQLIFDHTPLSEAVNELNRYSSVHVSLASPETGQLRVSGTFRVSDATNFTRAVADTYDLKLVRRDDEIVLEATSNLAAPR